MLLVSAIIIVAVMVANIVPHHQAIFQQSEDEPNTLLIALSLMSVDFSSQN